MCMLFKTNELLIWKFAFTLLTYYWLQNTEKKKRFWLDCNILTLRVIDIVETISVPLLVWFFFFALYMKKAMYFFNYDKVPIVGSLCMKTDSALSFI